ncbi:MAG: DUF1292 domain-containing protein [Clostridiales bacterium]|jgi:uncharacterized protein YrzB (UPF0473 family)|nr:DUF1292 domain-containing protein [Eubacteriales bacterium]MDH7567253.1 DUF1292 domain-containing protein [Clostridiales bacterium]
MSEERDDVLVLIDENGEESEFEHLDTIEMNGNEYVVLLPLDDSEEDEENLEEEDIDEVIILKIEHNNGEDSFVNVEDDEELEAVFEEFRERMEEYDSDED